MESLALRGCSSSFGCFFLSSGRGYAVRRGRRWRRTFPGLSCIARQPNRRQGSAKALQTCTQDIRRLTHRTRGGLCWGGCATCGEMSPEGTPMGAMRTLRPSSGTRLLEAAPPARRPVAAVGETPRPGTGAPWGEPRSRRAHGPGGPGAVAVAPPSSADLRVTRRGRRRAWGAALVAAPSAWTEAAEPPVRALYVRWCGRRGVVRPLPIPIRQHQNRSS
jgi:hypothetical protein